MITPNKFFYFNFTSQTVKPPNLLPGANHLQLVNVQSLQSQLGILVQVVFYYLSKLLFKKKKNLFFITLQAFQFTSLIKGLFIVKIGVLVLLVKVKIWSLYQFMTILSILQHKSYNLVLVLPKWAIWRKKALISYNSRPSPLQQTKGP